MTDMTQSTARLDELIRQLGLPVLCPDSDAPTRFDIELPDGRTVGSIVDRHIANNSNGKNISTPAIRDTIQSSVINVLFALLDEHDGDMVAAHNVINGIQKPRLGEVVITIFLSALGEMTDALYEARLQVTPETLEDIVGDGADALEDNLTYLDHSNGNRYFKPLSESYVWDLYHARCDDQ